jgi:hypothetical protein
VKAGVLFCFALFFGIMAISNSEKSQSHRHMNSKVLRNYGYEKHGNEAWLSMMVIPNREIKPRYRKQFHILTGLTHARTICHTILRFLKPNVCTPEMEKLKESEETRESYHIKKLPVLEPHQLIMFVRWH